MTSPRSLRQKEISGSGNRKSGSYFLRSSKANENKRKRDMGAAQAMKRIPRIKFPQRHPKPSGSGLQPQSATKTGDGDVTFLSSSKAPATAGGKASLQPKRTPVSKKEIEAILLGGCF